MLLSCSWLTGMSRVYKWKKSSWSPFSNPPGHVSTSEGGLKKLMRRSGRKETLWRGVWEYSQQTARCLCPLDLRDWDIKSLDTELTPDLLPTGCRKTLTQLHCVSQFLTFYSCIIMPASKISVQPSRCNETYSSWKNKHTQISGTTTVSWI